MEMKNNSVAIAIALAVILILGITIWYANDGSQANTSPTASTTSSTTIPATSGTTTTPSSAPHTTVTGTKTGTSTGTPPAPPTISSFTPAATTVGSTVVIRGTNFSRTKNYVQFGTSGGLKHADGSADNVVAEVASSDGQTLTFTVPTSGPSGILCDAQNNCKAVSARAITPGVYPVSVGTSVGTSKPSEITIIAQ